MVCGEIGVVEWVEEEEEEGVEFCLGGVQARCVRAGAAVVE